MTEPKTTDVALTVEEIDALRSAIPTRTLALTKAMAQERDAGWKANLRVERDALESALKKLAGAV